MLARYAFETKHVRKYYSGQWLMLLLLDLEIFVSKRTEKENYYVVLIQSVRETMCLFTLDHLFILVPRPSIWHLSYPLDTSETTAIQLYCIPNK